MYLFYIDETGSPEGHHEPLVDGETPIFALNSMCIRENDWRTLDRDYLTLKTRFFKNEIGTKEARYWEIKGSELTRPGSRTNKRAHAFIEQVLVLCQRYRTHLFSIIFLKNPINPTSKKSLYTMALQYLLERFHAFLEESEENEKGIMIIDSRMRNLDIEVAKSHQSFFFGHETGRTFHRIIEAPMFTDSQLTAGLQITDIIGSCIYTNFYTRNAMFIQGALDYSHMASHWQYLPVLEFKSNKLYDGYTRNGFRLIDFHNR